MKLLGKSFNEVIKEESKMNLIMKGEGSKMKLLGESLEWSC